MNETEDHGFETGGGTPSSPFSVPLFRNVWFSTLASNVGSTIQTVGAVWLMARLSASPLMVALVQSAANLPIMLLALWAGALADTYDRRRIMLTAQFLMLIASATLSILAILDRLSPATILAFTFLLACGTAVNWPAMQVSAASFVPRSILSRAVALNGMRVNVARTIGPALGGAIIASFGAAVAFLLNALSYLPLIFVLLRWRAVRNLPNEREPLLNTMIVGLRFAVRSPAVVKVLTRAALFGMATSAVSALLPLVARNILNGGPITYGMMLGGFGIGAVSGALATEAMRASWSPEQIVSRACVLIAVGALVMGISEWLPISFLAAGLAGAGWLVALSTFNVTIQLSSPQWIVARMLALYQVAAYGGIALGSLGFGALASRLGTPAAMVVSSVGLLAVAGFGRFRPISISKWDS